MSARIDIVNIGLTLLGADSIFSLEDETPEAKLMKTHYYIARDATLEAYEWSFAIKRFVPAKAELAPEWGWAFAFPIPADVLRVLTVERVTGTVMGMTNTNHMQRNQVDHVVEQRVILTNEGKIYCTGIRTIDDEGIYSNLFAHAFACKLALMTCLVLTESSQKFKEVAAMYAGAIREASSRDGQQGTTRRLRKTDWRRVRGA
jgi:hypothetical protein